MTAIETLAADLAKTAARDRANLAGDIASLIKKLERMQADVLAGRNGLSGTINLAQPAAMIEQRAVRIDATEASAREIRDAIAG
jgi:hypothetical protein